MINVRLTVSRATGHTDERFEEGAMPDTIVVQDTDDRPERMVRDPEGYFADARRRAEAEVRLNQNLPSALRRRHA